jgi:molybdopterin-guanine dinucleotide biosynthesis protein
MSTAPKVISIVGHSGSGKTTLVEKLIRELCVRGIKVATINTLTTRWNWIRRARTVFATRRLAQ